MPLRSQISAAGERPADVLSVGHAGTAPLPELLRFPFGDQGGRTPVAKSWHATVPLVITFDSHYQTPRLSATDDDEIANEHFLVEPPQTRTSELSAAELPVLGHL